MIREYRNRRVGVVLLALMVAVGCGGGLPSIPNTPEAILQKGDDHFTRESYYQSIELYKQFLARHPGHDRSDYAQFMLAESYFFDEQYPLASVEYRVLISNYGYSDNVDDALFKVGMCFFEEVLNSKRDQQQAYDALSQFEQFLRTFPQSPLVEETNRRIKDLHAKLAEKEYDNGRFYFRRKKMRAALIYFNKVIDSYPDNEFWARSLYYKGLILLERGEEEQAKHHLGQVLTYSQDLDIKQSVRELLGGMRPQ